MTKQHFYLSVKAVQKPLLAGTVGVAVLLYISFSKIDIVSPGQGVITGENDKVEIKSPNSGFINKFNLHEGDSVEKGMVLFSYTNLDYTYKGLTLKDIIDFNRDKINYLKKDSALLKSLLITSTSSPQQQETLSSSGYADLSYFSFKAEYDAILLDEQSLNEKEKLLQQEVQLREKQISYLQRKDSLLKKGGASDIDIINNLSDIDRQKTELINVKMSFLTLRNDLENAKTQFKTKLYDKINSIREQIDTLQKNNIENQGELKLMNDKVSTNIVTAPFSGKILKIENNLKQGSFIEQYQSIMTVKQDTNGQVIEAKFDTKYRPYLYQGASVKISVNSTAFKKNFSARIAKISPDSFVDNTRGNTEYRYYSVTIDSFQDIDTSKLPEGIEVNVFATSKKVSILEYMIATLKSDMTFNVW
ncbi:HlyD family efflux transporter periplasmic adaptor subunit [Edwardsiella hoshinae]|uniref:Dihydrolipoamide acetyltransferase n=1 Tax=Edwardsiella hoshinae TaxID=93378 RepID=A0A376DBT1_9GAMM|nr:HlyD family efflux transporter periplasmic adaptor subunit [Edwardsiella hoshinae]QPR27645.1 HlyD family efflux transporter periplasmic adaptor subunit [Edwardsiella hoshinae]STC86573.1 dihydrolipoamide acetyltransferase [Edwardsiella hoshinae]